MDNTPIPFKPSHTAIHSLVEVIQSIAVDRMLADTVKYPTLHSAVLSVLGDAGHDEMARTWAEMRGQR